MRPQFGSEMEYEYSPSFLEVGKEVLVMRKCIRRDLGTCRESLTITKNFLQKVWSRHV